MNINPMAMIENHIFSVPNKDKGYFGSENPGEIKERNIEFKFIQKLSEIICEILDISYNDRRIFQSLLSKQLSDPLNNRGGRNEHLGMRQQYLAHELEEIATSIKRDLLLPKEINIDHDHSTHAKFSSIVDYIKNHYVRIEDINSDGTFETIYQVKCKLEEH